MTFDAAYREGYVAGVTAHVEHSRCQRCYDAGQARVAALTAERDEALRDVEGALWQREAAYAKVAALTAALEDVVRGWMEGDDLYTTIQRAKAVLAAGGA